MDGNVGRGLARSTPRGELTRDGTTNWLVLALSAAGVLCILLGLLALAVPAAREGAMIWQVDGRHTVHMMDAAGLTASALGVLLIWLSGQLWQRHTQL